MTICQIRDLRKQNKKTWFPFNRKLKTKLRSGMKDVRISSAFMHATPFGNYEYCAFASIKFQSHIIDHLIASISIYPKFDDGRTRPNTKCKWISIFNWPMVIAQLPSIYHIGSGFCIRRGIHTHTFSCNRSNELPFPFTKRSQTNYGNNFNFGLNLMRIVSSVSFASVFIRHTMKIETTVVI